VTRLICLASLICAICVSTPVISEKLAIENMCSTEHTVSVKESTGKETMSENVRLTATANVYPDWELLNSTPELSRGGANMVYDSVRAMTVLFGGWVGASPVAETWEYHDKCNYWSQVTTVNSPTARVLYSLVYDSKRDRVILFGGLDPTTNTYFNDTWEYDGLDWQQITTSTSPPARSARTMVFDSERNRTVLVGGDGPSDGYNDTWEFDGIDWSLISTTASPPAPGQLAAMAYDEARSRTVLSFHDGTSQLQTWEYDGSSWLKVNTPASPLGRWAHTMAYDAVSQRVMLFGGTSPYSSSELPMNDGWEYDGNTWTEIATPNTPPPADQHSMAFDTRIGRIIVLNWGETWVYSHHATAVDCPFAEFRIYPREVYLRDGKTSEQIRMEVRDRELRPVNPDLIEFEFTSSDPDLVQISPEGLVTSMGYGRAQVVVTMVGLGIQSTVDVYAGHLRSAPLFQYLSVTGQSSGSVRPDIANADGTPVDLEGREVTFECYGCASGEPLQIDANGNLLVVEDFELGDPLPAVTVLVDGERAGHSSIIHVSENDLGLTLKEYVTHNTIISSATTAAGIDLDAVITNFLMPELFDLGFEWQAYLMSGTWWGGPRQAAINYTSHYRFDGIFPGCGGSGNPIRMGTNIENPDASCFFKNLTETELAPQWGIVFHELGHNMTWTAGLFGKFAGAGDGFNYSEGMATAAGMFTCEAILRAGEAVGLTEKIAQPLAHSWLCWRHYEQGTMLQAYIGAGADYSTIDPNIIDDMLWHLVQEFDYGLIYRLFGMFTPRDQGDYPFEIVTTERQATMFAVGCSVAVGVDLKSRFRDEWGFPIND